MSRSVWKASLALADYLFHNHQLFLHNITVTLKVLELGSGPGLAGIFTQAYLRNSEVYLTDICHKSLNLIKENIEINKDLLNQEKLSVNYFEWGNFSKDTGMADHY